jgi:BASS family bile acid:Na+ symporter
MKVEDFKGIVTAPRGTLIGLAAHSLLLPSLAFLLTIVLDPSPSIALGMILVASCPSGNISNFLVNYAHGNPALSVTIAAFSMLGSVVFTPFNLTFWGAMNPSTRAISTSAEPMAGIARSSYCSPSDAARHDRGASPSATWRARAVPMLSLAFFALFWSARRQLEFFAASPPYGPLRVPAQRARVGNGLLRRSSRGTRRTDGPSPSSRHQNPIGLALVFNFFDGLGGMRSRRVVGHRHLLAGTARSRPAERGARRWTTGRHRERRNAARRNFDGRPCS